MITKINMEALASILKKTRFYPEGENHAAVTLGLADYIETINPRFNRIKFMYARGYIKDWDGQWIKNERDEK